MKDGIRKALAFLLCFSLVFGSVVYRPQRAEAVGLTASAIIVSGIVAVMAACGVTIAAQTDTGITDYITDKLDDYFQTLSSVPESILDWLELESPVYVFTVLTSGQLRFTRPVANKILDFVRWFNTDQGVQSGGETVGVFNDAGATIPINVNGASESGVQYGYLWYRGAETSANVITCINGTGLLFYYGNGVNSWTTIAVSVPVGSQNTFYGYNGNLTTNGFKYKTPVYIETLDTGP